MFECGSGRAGGRGQGAEGDGRAATTPRTSGSNRGRPRSSCGGGTDGRLPPRAQVGRRGGRDKAEGRARQGVCFIVSNKGVGEAQPVGAGGAHAIAAIATTGRQAGRQAAEAQPGGLGTRQGEEGQRGGRAREGGRATAACRTSCRRSLRGLPRGARQPVRGPPRRRMRLNASMRRWRARSRRSYPRNLPVRPCGAVPGPSQYPEG